MAGDVDVAGHYAHPDLIAAVESGLAELGKTRLDVSVEDLAAVDEFHVGGRVATRRLLDRLHLESGRRVLDVGCGLGGAARLAASQFGVRVDGVDLTPAYIEAGRELCSWVGLDGLVELHPGSALEMSFPDASFDAAIMLHVAMNIEDKDGLFREVARVLRPGGYFGVYDLMHVGPGDVAYPTPWAATAGTSFLETPESYRNAVAATGFDVVREENRREAGLRFFRKVRERAAAEGGPPPLGLHTLMGHHTAERIGNLFDGLEKGCIAPVELIVRRR